MNTPKPLTGVRVLVGRARRQAGALSSELKALGAEVLEIPLIEIRPPDSYRPFDSALRRIDEYDWLILTSVNGVEAVAARVKKLRVSPRQLAGLQIAAIGPATRREIEKLGLTVAVMPREYVAESVVESLRGKVEGKRVLLARASVARDVIPRELRKMGARADVVEAYKTVLPRSSREKLRMALNDPALRPHVIAFTSSSTVRNFVALINTRQGRARTETGQPPLSLDGIYFASIGPVTSATLREFGLPVQIQAKEYTVEGLTRAIVDWARAREAYG